MNDVERFIAKAEELDAVAERFERPEHRAEYRRLARNWRLLAVDLPDAAPSPLTNTR